MFNKIQEKLDLKYILLISISLLYFIILLFNKDSFLRLMSEFLNILYKVLPIFLLIFILMFLFNLFFDTKSIKKYLGHESGFKAWFISVISGIISAGPIYMWYPLLKQLKEHGMHEKFIYVFLFNRSVKLPLLPIMIYYFGLKFTVIFNLYIVVFSIIGGYIFNLFFKKNTNENSNSVS